MDGRVVPAAAWAAISDAVITLCGRRRSYARHRSDDAEANLEPCARARRHTSRRSLTSAVGQSTSEARSGYAFLVVAEGEDPPWSACGATPIALRWAAGQARDDLDGVEHPEPPPNSLDAVAERVTLMLAGIDAGDHRAFNAAFETAMAEDLAEGDRHGE